MPPGLNSHPSPSQFFNPLTLKNSGTSLAMGAGEWILVAVVLFLLLFKLWANFSVKKYSSVEPSDNIPRRPKQVRIDSYKLDPATIKANVTQIAAQFKDSDIVVLQGAAQSGSNAVASLIDAFKANGFKFFTSGPLPGLVSTKYLDSGLLVLSKFPASINDQIAFKKSSNRFATQGALYVKFRVSVFEFFHLAFATLAPGSGARASQVSDLVALVERHVNDSFPFFVIGGVGASGRQGAEYGALVSALAVKGRQPVDFLKAEQGGDAFFRLTGKDDAGLVFGNIEASATTIQLGGQPRSGIAATLDLVPGY
jgi:hypothetical protein